MQWGDGSPYTYQDWLLKPSALASLTLIKPFGRPDTIKYWTPAIRDAFRRDQPSDITQHNCTAIFLLDKYTPVWIKVPCHEKMGFSKILCQRKSDLLFPSGASRLSRECPDSWIYIQQQCFHIVRQSAVLHTQQNVTNHTCQIASVLHIDKLRLYFTSLLAWQPPLGILMKLSDNFTSGCTLVPSDIETRHDSETLAGGFIIRDCASLAQGAQAVVCEMESSIISLGTCLPSMFQCKDGSCILNRYLCDGKPQCLDNSDEANCFDVCSSPNGKVASAQYCFTVCKEPLCKCSWNYFQCQQRGCVPWWVVCDCVEDCSDGSDETQCVSCQSTLGQIISSNSQENNRRDYAYLDYTVESEISVSHNNLNISCVSYGYTPCSEDYSQCFPPEALCVFERLSGNNIRYCTNGMHLRSCYLFECPKHYKCAYSYCIPLHSICNGELDCPSGEDEQECDDHLCLDLLRCSKEGYCVHPAYLLDGHVQCPLTADDEDIYVLQPCPGGCFCIGELIKCHILEKLPSVYHRVKKLDLRNATFEYTKESFVAFRDLLALDISENKLEHLYDELFLWQNSMITLNMESNNLKIVKRLHLSGLQNLRYLNLKYNPIGLIDSFGFHPVGMAKVLDISQLRLHRVNHLAFSGMVHCARLNLSFNWLSEIVSGTFSGMPGLQILDLRGNPILVFIPDEFMRIRLLLQIYMPRKEFCCRVSLPGACSPSSGVSRSCYLYIQNRAVKTLGWCLVVLSILINGILFLLQVRNKNSRLFTMNVLKGIMGMLMSLSLCFVLVMDSTFHGFYVALYEFNLPTNPFCLVTNFLFVSSFESVFLISAMRTVFKTVAVIYPLKTKLIVTRKVIYLSIIACMAFVEVLTCLILSRDGHFRFTALGPYCGIIISSTGNDVPISYSIMLCTNSALTMLIIGLSLATLQSLLTTRTPTALKTCQSRALTTKQRAARQTLLSMANSCVGMLFFLILNISFLSGLVVTREVHAVITILILPASMLLEPCFDLLTSYDTLKKMIEIVKHVGRKV